MKTCYHATTLEGAKAIIESGYFKAGCYFAFRRKDALNFAGPVLFEAKFDLFTYDHCFNDMFENANGYPMTWQFWIQSDVPLSQVCASRHWASELVSDGL